MRFRPYKACDAKYIVKWIQDKKTMYQWSADRIGVYPLTEEALNQHYRNIEENDSFWEFTATDEENVPVGHMIMRYLDEGKTVNFGFVVVDNTLRGKGYGKQMLSMAKEYAFSMLHAEKLALGVFENNEKARHCYEAVGFCMAKGQEAYYVPIEGEEWKCFSMESLK